jgi:hypothetical protein
VGTTGTFRERQSGGRYPLQVIQKLGRVDLGATDFDFAAPGITFAQGTTAQITKLFLVLARVPALKQQMASDCRLGAYGTSTFDVPWTPF